MTKRVEKQEEVVEAAMEFPLTTPINAYGEEVTVLKLRKPTGADLLSVGNPIQFNPYIEPPEVKHDFKKVVAMTARLANVPSSSLDKLSASDLIRLGWAISPFFL